MIHANLVQVAPRGKVGIAPPCRRCAAWLLRAGPGEAGSMALQPRETHNGKRPAQNESTADRRSSGRWTLDRAERRSVVALAAAAPSGGSRGSRPAGTRADA